MNLYVHLTSPVLPNHVRYFPVGFCWGQLMSSSDYRLLAFCDTHGTIEKIKKWRTQSCKVRKSTCFIKQLLVWSAIFEALFFIRKFVKHTRHLLSEKTSVWAQKLLQIISISLQIFIRTWKYPHKLPLAGLIVTSRESCGFSMEKTRIFSR